MNELFGLLMKLMQFYGYALLIYILLSWLPDVKASNFGQMLGKICEPYLEPFRRIIPPLGMIDISPIVAIFTLHLARIGLSVLAGML